MLGSFTKGSQTLGNLLKTMFFYLFLLILPGAFYPEIYNNDKPFPSTVSMFKN